jgi:transcriptional regulator with XRE-family HTH domain
MSTVLSDDAAKKNVAANLSRLILDHKTSRRGVAKATGESHTIISQYAAGHKLPGSGALARLAEFFGVSTDYLLSTPKRNRKQSA